MNAKNLIRKARQLLNLPVHLEQEIDLLKFIQGQQLVREQRLRDIHDIHEAEFKVFSQWGEDGIIQWALSKLSPPPA